MIRRATTSSIQEVNFVFSLLRSYFLIYIVTNVVSITSRFPFVVESDDLRGMDAMLEAIPSSEMDVAMLVIDDNLRDIEFITDHQSIGPSLASRLGEEEFIASLPEAQVAKRDGTGRQEEEMATDSL